MWVIVWVWFDTAKKHDRQREFQKARPAPCNYARERI